MQSQHTKEVVKDISSAAQLETELVISQAQHGIAVLDLYNAEWGSCKALGETFRRLFTDAGDAVHLRFFSVECNAVMESLARPEETKATGRPRSVASSPDTQPVVWGPLVDAHRSHSRPFFLFYKEGKLRGRLEGIDTPRICKLVQELCRPQPPATDFLTNTDAMRFWEVHFSLAGSEVPAREVLAALEREGALHSLRSLLKEDTAAMATAIGVDDNGNITAAAFQQWVGETGTVADTMSACIAAAAAAAPMRQSHHHQADTEEPEEAAEEETVQGHATDRGLDEEGSYAAEVEGGEDAANTGEVAEADSYPAKAEGDEAPAAADETAIGSSDAVSAELAREAEEEEEEREEEEAGEGAAETSAADEDSAHPAEADGGEEAAKTPDDAEEGSYPAEVEANEALAAADETQEAGEVVAVDRDVQEEDAYLTEAEAGEEAAAAAATTTDSWEEITPEAAAELAPEGEEKEESEEVPAAVHAAQSEDAYPTEAEASETTAVTPIAEEVDAYPTEEESNEAAAGADEAQEDGEAAAVARDVQEEESYPTEEESNEAAAGADEAQEDGEAAAVARDVQEEESYLTEAEAGEETAAAAATTTDSWEEITPEAAAAVEAAAAAGSPASASGGTTGIHQIFTDRWITVSEEEMRVWNVVAALPLHYPASTTTLLQPAGPAVVERAVRLVPPVPATYPTVTEYLDGQGVPPGDVNMMCLAAEQKVGSESLSSGKLALILLSCDAEGTAGLLPQPYDLRSDLSAGTVIDSHQPLALAALCLCASEAYPDECFYYLEPVGAAPLEVAEGSELTLAALSPLHASAPAAGSSRRFRIVGLPKVIELATTDDSEETMVLSQWFAKLRVTAATDEEVHLQFVEGICSEDFDEFAAVYTARLIEAEGRLDKKPDPAGTGAADAAPAAEAEVEDDDDDDDAEL